jgi:endonuclease/exonuclease/phosphatase (EEP) superfamily protein YafD
MIDGWTFVAISALVAAGLLVVGTALPLLKTGAWLVRTWDFPRLQLLFLAGVGCVACGTCWWTEAPMTWAWGTAAGVMAIVAIAQAGQIVRYTPLWGVEVETAHRRSLRLAVMNLDKNNQEGEAVTARIAELSPDLLLLIEYGPSWAEGLNEARATFAHHVEHVEDDGLGIALWSRLELDDPQVRAIVTEKRKSIHTDVRLGGGRRVRFVGLHPTPPSYIPPDREERYDSWLRDAELIRVAEEIGAARAERGGGPTWVVAGDMNDVAWSHTTRLFKRLSGLVDPRVGRGMYNTFHARMPWLRFPVDHVFVSDELGVASMRRVRIAGSDHFGVLADLGWVKAEKEVEPDAQAEDRQEAARVIEAGVEDAGALGEASDEAESTRAAAS